MGAWCEMLLILMSSGTSLPLGSAGQDALAGQPVLLWHPPPSFCTTCRHPHPRYPHPKHHHGSNTFMLQQPWPRLDTKER